MSRVSRGLVFAVGTTALSLFGSLASAPLAGASIIISNVQVPYAEGITLTSTASSPAGLFGGIGNSLGVGIAGQIVLTTQPGNMLLDVWCVDLFHTINIGGSYTYTAGVFATDNTPPGPPLFGPNALLATQISDISALAAYGNSLMSTTPSSHLSAAFQAAIWNVEYGTTASGSALFNADLAWIMATLPSLSAPGGYQISGLNGQGLLVNQGLYVSDAPEPSTLATLAFALLTLLSFGLIRRRV